MSPLELRRRQVRESIDNMIRAAEYERAVDVAVPIIEVLEAHLEQIDRALIVEAARARVQVPNTAQVQAAVPQPIRDADGPTLSPEQVAGLLGISRSMVYKLVRGRRIAHRRVGRRVVIDRAAVEEYRKRAAVEPPAPPPPAGYKFKHI